MAELVLKDIHKTYTAANGSRRQVLAGINLSVDPGEFVVLVGPSGCGKTTLLKIIAGLVLPDNGDFTLTIDGKPITQPGPDRGVVFQQYHSYPWLSVLENVEFGLQFMGLPKRERRERAEEQLRVVGLLEYRDEYPAVLSGGQQQRVAIARTLATGPRVILMDEPFAALDAQTRETMQAELLQLQGRTQATIVFVTHDIAEAAFLGNQVYVLSRMPATITAHIDARKSRERAMEALGVESVREGQDSRLDAKRGEWLRYDVEFVEIQKSLKQALESQPQSLGTGERVDLGDIRSDESLADRDAELAGTILNLVHDPALLKTKSDAVLTWWARYCLRRLRLLRMGGRSAPLVALCVLVWHCPSKLRISVEETLGLAFSISADPSYIWPEWAIVLVATILARFDSLAAADARLTEKARAEILKQAELRLTHLERTIEPTATAGVRSAATALLVALRSGFPNGIKPVVDAASEGWPVVASRLSETEFKARVADLDRSMPAWYTEEDRAIYRDHMERRNAWLISAARLALRT